MISQGMSTVVSKLQGDWDFIKSFLSNPQMALSGFNLSQNEVDALCARDVDALSSLGLDTNAVLGATSGGHSQTCNPC